MKNKETKIFGRNLLIFLKQREMSQARLSDLSGLTKSAISMICNGSREPSLSSIVKICNALEISADYLIYIIVKEKCSHQLKKVLHEEILEKVHAALFELENKT